MTRPALVMWRLRPRLCSRQTRCPCRRRSLQRRRSLSSECCAGVVMCVVMCCSTGAAATMPWRGVLTFVRLMRVCVLRYSPPTGNTGNGDTDTRTQPRHDAHPADHAALVARAAEAALQPPPPPPPPHLPAHAYGRSGTAPTRSPRFDASSSAYEYDAPGLRSGSGDPASRTGRLITSASRVAAGRGGSASQLSGTTTATAPAPAPAPAPARPSEQQGGGEEGEQWIIDEGRRFLEKFRASQAATRHYFSGN